MLKDRYRVKGATIVSTDAIRTILVASVAFVQMVACGIEICANWQIATPDPEPSGLQARLAHNADKLAADIRESTGMTLSRVTRSTAAKRNVIFIGGEFAERAGLMSQSLKGQENCIVEKDGNIYIFGRDHAGARPVGSPYRQVLSMPSLRALTRFMYQFMGVRFVFPGENGRAVSRRKGIEVPNGYSDCERPVFDYSALGGWFDDLYHFGNNMFGWSDYFSYGGHSYPYACGSTRYFKEHPEYFCEENGKRRLNSWSPSHTALCISNPAVEELIVAELLKRFDAGASVCQLAQQDGGEVCGCGNCRALYGTGDDWCEKFWRFHVHIAERIRKERPGKMVHILSYGRTERPPKSFKAFPDNVMIELCRYTEADLKEWQSYKVPGGFTAYIYNWGCYPLPGFTAKRSFQGCARLIRRFRQYGVHGIYRCGYGELPGMEGAQYYVFNRLMENADADIGQMVREFCDAAFGKTAGEPMKRFYETLDRRLRMFDLIEAPYTEVASGKPGEYEMAMPRDPIDLIGWIYSPVVMSEMEGAMSVAERSPDLTDKERIRLKRVRLEFDYAKSLGRIAALYAAYRVRPCKELFVPLAEEIKARNAFIDEMFDKKGKMRPLPDWPEAPLFRAADRQKVMDNGRLEAKIKLPLDWDVDRMLAEERYPLAPGQVEKCRAYHREHNLKPITEWGVAGWRAGNGMRFERRDGGRGFLFSPGTNTDMRVVTVVGPKEGLKPNTRYRLSWFARLTDVSCCKHEGGFYVSVYYGRHPLFMKEPAGFGMTGSTDWIHMETVFTIIDDPSFKSQITFRILNGHGTVEIDDVTLEELPKENSK